MRIVNLAALIAAVLLTAAAAPAAESDAPGAYRLIDLSGEFTRIYTETAGQPDAARVAAFEREIVPRFPRFYGRERYKHLSDAQYEARIARAFAQFADIQGPYELTGRSFAQGLNPALRTFRQRLPDLGPIGDIYLIHSLGEMDGGTREFDGQRYFVFGADVIARLHPPGSERPFFHHELFHIYHQQFFAECPAVWCSLWAEGLAVYAASELNPGATDAELLLVGPEPIRADVDAHLSEAICAIQTRLDSTGGADLGALFSSQRLSANLPPRFGYYVGYLVAREARRTHSLQQLAHLPAKDVRPLVEASLAARAACPAP